MNAAASMVGLRVNWTCAECRRTDTTRQIATFESPNSARVYIDVAPPPGWTVRGDRVYCPAHESIARRRGAA
jgi:hypothetical protein